MIDTILFDFDRTLFNVDIPEQRALSHIHDLHVEKHIPVDRFIQTYKDVNEHWWYLRSQHKATLEQVRLNSLSDTFKRLKTSMPIPVHELSHQYVSEARKHWHLYPHVPETLSQLRERGYKIGIVTNGFSTVQHPKIDAVNLRPLVDQFTISDEVGLAKPDPRIFDHCIDDLKSNRSRSVYVGDNLRDDYQGAKNTGLPFIWFNEHKRANPHGLPEFQSYSDLLRRIESLTFHG